MKKLLACLLLVQFLSVAPGLAAELIFGWTPNTENDLAGYRIHYGTKPGTYTDAVDVGLPIVKDGKVVATISPPYGSKYFACTAYAASGAESDYSNEVMEVIPPSAPGGLELSSAAVTYYFVPKKILIPKP